MAGVGSDIGAELADDKPDHTRDESRGTTRVLLRGRTRRHTARHIHGRPHGGPSTNPVIPGWPAGPLSREPTGNHPVTVTARMRPRESLRSVRKHAAHRTPPRTRSGRTSTQHPWGSDHPRARPRVARKTRTVHSAGFHVRR